MAEECESRPSAMGAGAPVVANTPEPSHSGRAWSLLVVAVLSSLLAFALVGCGDSEAPDVTETVTVGLVNTVYSAIVYVAQERGYFADEGLDVVLRDYESGAAAVQGLVAGEVDLATAADFVVASHYFEVPELRVVAALGTTTRAVVLVARADRGIAGPADLAGKTVAAPPKTQAQFFLETHLLFNLVPRSAVAVRLLSPGESADALEAGTVDAVMIWQPNADRLIERMGAGGTVSWDGQDAQQMLWLLAGTEKSTSSRPETMVALVRALHRAEEEVRGHPDASRSAVVSASGLDPEHVAGFWPDFRFELALDQSLLVSFEEETRWMMDSGMVTAQAPPDFLDAFYFPALESVKPDSVTVIR